MMSGMAELLTGLVSGIRSGGIRVVDLTQTLTPETPIIGLPPEFGQTWTFELHEISKYDERGPFWYWNNIRTGEHTGTHFDAPVHWISGKDHPDNATDTIPPEHFIAPACVIDCSARVKDNPDYLLTPAHVEEWEKRHGRVPAGAWVLMRTDWATTHTEPAAYLNVKEDGAHTPGPHPDLVPFLARERNVLGFGNETVGTDAGQAFAFDPPFPCHSGMHGANKYGLASLVNLDQLPPTGAVVIAAPLKIINGSGSPCRVIALVPTT
jgi:kynurenine formamidase